MEWFYWISWAQIWLIVGLFLIGMDLFIPSGGLLAATGLTVLSAALLAWFQVAWWIYLVVLPPMAALFVALCLWVLAKGGGLLERWILPEKIKTNMDALPGREGLVRQLREDGLVYVEVQGDRWLSTVEGKARVEVGTRVRIVRVQEGRLVVSIC